MARKAPVEVDLSASGVFVTETVHDPSFQMEYQVHPFHEIFHVVRGQINVLWTDQANGRRDGRSVAGSQVSPSTMGVTAGSYVVVPAGVAHRLEDTSGSTLLLLCLDQSHVARPAERATIWAELIGSSLSTGHRTSRGFAPVLVPGSEDTRPLWRRMLALQYRLVSPERNLELWSWTDQLLLSLVNEKRRGGGGDSISRIQRFVERLPERVYEPWTVPRAARETGLSVRRFAQLFRSTTGSSFVPHLTELRIRRVCRLLETGRHSVVGAAFSCGFEDVSHFYRVFKAYRGCTPREYLEGREGCRGEER